MLRVVISKFVTHEKYYCGHRSTVLIVPVVTLIDKFMLIAMMILTPSGSSTDVHEVIEVLQLAPQPAWL
jgi:hypothetical protein